MGASGSAAECEPLYKGFAVASGVLRAEGDFCAASAERVRLMGVFSPPLPRDPPCAAAPRFEPLLTLPRRSSSGA